MKAKKIRIKVNEKEVEVSGDITAGKLKRTFKPKSDLTIYNGAPLEGEVILKSGDEIVFIRRGEIPSKGELETLMVARHTPGTYKRIKQSRVGIAGMGGLGSAVAVALARIGVGKLVLADEDVVEPSNLNRQQYFVDQIGMVKVKAMKENLKRINPYVKVETHRVHLDETNIPEVFKDVQVLVEGFDDPESKILLYEVFSKAKPKVPMVMASGLAGFGPNNAIKTRKVGRNLCVVGDLTSGAKPGGGLMAPRVGIAAHHQANAVLQIIMGKEAAN